MKLRVGDIILCHDKPREILEVKVDKNNHKEYRVFLSEPENNCMSWHKRRCFKKIIPLK